MVYIRNKKVTFHSYVKFTRGYPHILPTQVIGVQQIALFFSESPTKKKAGFV